MTDAILIVDDNQDNLMVLEQILTNEGYVVRAATSGEIALKSAKMRPPDLILLDIMMPGMDGFEVCRRLKERPETAPIPVLFISALQETEGKVQAFKQGGVDYITKPFSTPEVLARVRTHLRLYRMERDLQAEVARAIADKELAFEEVRRSEERYRRITESLTDYIYLVRVAQGRPVERKHGEGCLAVTGYTAEELDTDEALASRIVSPTDRALVAAQEDALFSGASPEPIEHRLVRKDGKERWVRRTVVPRRDEGGTLVSYDGLIQDITERRQLTQQLIQAQKMESIGQMAGAVVHDFNNILTVVGGYATLMIQEPFAGAELVEMGRELAQAVERGLTITRGLLTFSRKQPLVVGKINLNEVIVGFEGMLRTLCGSPVQVVCVLAPRPLVMNADRTQLAQVIMNLCANARDAMPNGGTVRITTGIARVDAQKARALALPTVSEYATITVSDTGTGMDEETQLKLFEPFFTTKPEGKGTGLGLPIVYGIVKQHGGAVAVTSRLGAGTTFTVYLPFASETETSPKGPELVGADGFKNSPGALVGQRASVDGASFSRSRP